MICGLCYLASLRVFNGEDMIYLFLACQGTKSPQPIVPKSSTVSLPVEEKTEVIAPREQKSTVVLDGVVLEANWDDGDTFSAIHPETGKKIKARLSGFNTLESYGPVHRWGDWTGTGLYGIAQKAGVFARSKKWTCSDTKNGGGYGRLLVDCPDLRKEILEAGLATPFSIGAPSSQSDLDAMNIAMAARKGMWEKGIPKFMISSLHSQDENLDKDAYNRICDLGSGECSKKVHQNTYAVCQEVCIEDSCMIYVPFSNRYRNKPECLL
jgi:endonuclease YncB( thermonuclease family)